MCVSRLDAGFALCFIRGSTVMNDSDQFLVSLSLSVYTYLCILYININNKYVYT